MKRALVIQVPTLLEHQALRFEFSRYTAGICVCVCVHVYIFTKVDTDKSYQSLHVSYLNVYSSSMS